MQVYKYEGGTFGCCPRVFCHSTHVLPCGRSDMPGIDTVKLYCPNCGDIYTPPSSKYSGVDGQFALRCAKLTIAGAFFGTSFAPLFFQTYPELLSAPFAPQTPPRGSATPSDRRMTPSPSRPVGGETLTNPNPYGGQRPALGKVYVPRIYGFKVSERARSGPRMRWLRERPERYEELEQVDWKGRWKDGPGAAGVGEADTPQPKGRNGRLFDDDDDDEEVQESEEEEEDAPPQAQAQRVR